MTRTQWASNRSRWRDDRGRGRIVAEHGDERALEQGSELVPLLRGLRVDPQGEVGGADVLPSQRLQLAHRRAPELTVAAQVLVADGFAQQRALALDPAHLDPQVRVRAECTTSDSSRPAATRSTA